MLIKPLVIQLALFTTSAFAQDPQAILQKVSEKYGALQSYFFEGKTLAESENDGKRNVQETAFEIAYASPKRLRVMFRYPGGDSWLRLSDGTTLVRFRASAKDLKREPSSDNDLFILKGTFVGDLQQLERTTSAANLTGSESLSVDGKNVECYVIEAKQRRTLPDGTEALPTKWWIDKNRMIVLKQVSGTRSKFGDHVNRNIRTIVLTKATVDEPVSDRLFQYASK